MLSMSTKLSDQIRDAVKDSGMTKYRIAAATGVQQSSLSRFMRGGSLSLDTLDRLADVLGLVVVVKKPKRRKEQ
jgi:transcriptional regulator with XRE-family HTH domain